mgnify:FL=1
MNKIQEDAKKVYIEKLKNMEQVLNQAVINLDENGEATSIGNILYEAQSVLNNARKEDSEKYWPILLKIQELVPINEN